MAVGIADFDWDEKDGFTVVDEITEDKKTSKGSDKTTEEDSEKEPEFEISFDTDVKDGKDEGGKSTNTTTSINTEDATFKTLKEKNLFTVELEEGDDLETAWDKQITKDVDDAIADMFSELKKDKEAIALIKHLKEGGNVSDFVNNSSYAINTDISTEEAQIKTVKDFYSKHKKMDADEVDDLVETLKNNGKLEGRAESVKNLIEAERIKEDEARQLAAKTNREKAINQHKDLTTSLTGIVRDNKFEFKGIGKDKNDTELVTFITTPLKDGRTGLQKEISDLFKVENHEELLILAKLIKTKFDFSKVAKKGGTTEVKKIKDNLENRSVNIQTGGASKRSTSSIADLFD